jgi:hypothetical protein
MKSLVLANPKGGTVIWKKVGEIVEVKDPEFAFKILSQCGDMIEHVEAEGTPETPEEEKVAKAPKNRAAKAPVTK